VAAIAALAALVFVMNPSGPQPPAEQRLSSGGKPSKIREANEYYERAMVATRGGQFDLQRMRRMLERALELDPKFAEARAEYATTHMLTVLTGVSNDTSWIYKAEEEARRALQDDSECGRARASLAAVYVQQGRKEPALAEAEKAIKLNPNEPNAQLLFLSFHWYNGDLTEARAVGQQIRERFPLFFPARMFLGEILMEQGDTAAAIGEQEKILEQDPEHRPAALFLTRAYLYSGRLAEARWILERARSAAPQNYSHRPYWAMLLALEGKRTEALREMDEEALKYCGAMLPMTLLPADFYAVAGDKPKALDWLERAVRAGDDREEWFLRNPMLAKIRDEPRFKQILESVAHRRAQRAKAKQQ